MIFDVIFEEESSNLMHFTLKGCNSRFCSAVKRSQNINHCVGNGVTHIELVEIASAVDCRQHESISPKAEKKSVPLLVNTFFMKVKAFKELPALSCGSFSCR